MRNPIPVLAVLLAFIAPDVAAASVCKLVQIAEFRVRARNAQPIVDGKINGKDAGILIDTGATTTVLYMAAAQRLGLALRASGRSFYGVGGVSQAHEVDLDEVRLGDATRKNWTLLVVSGASRAPFDFILGDDFFRHVELEFDFRNDAMRLFKAEGCENSPLAYWSPKEYHEVRISSGGRIEVPVHLNGVRLSALLDTGASNSVLTLRAAARAGVRPDSQGVTQGGCAAGIGARTVTDWIGPFETFSIGDETVHHPRIRFADLWRNARRDNSGHLARSAEEFDMILGMDFLRTHRVFVSRAQRKMYFTYQDGLVFPSMTATGCDAEQHRDAEQRIAAYDAAIAKDADNVNPLLLRAREWMAKREYGKALADLEEALRRSPTNGLAFAYRGDVRMAQRKFDLAIADYDLSIRYGSRVASVYVTRGNAWRAKGDNAKAVAEYTQALELDPRNTAAYVARASLRGQEQQYDLAIADCDAAIAIDKAHSLAYRARAHLFFRLARYADAGKDFGERMTLSPSGQAAVWKYLSRARAGEQTLDDLKKDAVAAKMQGWPEPIARFYLGDIDAAAFLAAAAQGDDMKRREQECEANFHLGQRELMTRGRNEARLHLQKAVDQCPADFVELFAARSELARIP